ncbi:MAG: SCO2322 family protein [Candidatus Nanopelagicales bacterium]
MRLRALAGTGAMVCVTVALAPAVAHADGYRYWSYWTGGQSWSYSDRGPGFLIPGDGAVEGWRFVVSPENGSQATAPATPSSYDQVCPGQPAAPAGRKRVAVVIDFGPAGIAPIGESPPPTSISCVTAPARATGLQVLQQVAKVRFQASGLICGIAGFPAQECPGQSVKAVTQSPTAQPARTAPVAPAPANTADGPAAPPTTLPDASPRPTDSSTPTRAPSTPTDQPSAVALTVPGDSAEEPSTQPPAWIAAIGATMIALLLAVALLLRRGRHD